MVGTVAIPPSTEPGTGGASRAPAQPRYPAARWQQWRRLSPWRKLGFAWRGLDVLGRDLAHHGPLGWVMAVALFPAALLYLLASVAWDSVVYGFRSSSAGSRSDRREYVRRRFAGNQRLVHWREGRVVARFLRRIGTVDRVLDAPCGYGRLAPALAGAGTLVSADVDRARLLGLRANARPGASAAVVQADLRTGLPFGSATFDLVVTMRYLHHVRTPEARRSVLAELARVSRGVVLLSYYRRSNLHALVRTVQTVTRGDRRRPPTMLSRREIEGLLRDAGYRTVCDLAVIPCFHAQRIALLEVRPRRGVVPRGGWMRVAASRADAHRGIIVCAGSTKSRVGTPRRLLSVGEP